MKKKAKRKIKYKKILMFFLFVFFAIYLFYKIFNLNITNIYVYNNELLKDQEIIDLSGISNYPKTINYPTWVIKNNILKSLYVKNVEVKKEKFTIVKIYIDENNPLFYYETKEKTILEDGRKVDEIFSIPRLINEIDENYYNEFLNKMNLVNKKILDRISEIKYDPNDLDKERFLLIMNDGNYVYLTLNKFEAINNYVSIIKNFDNKKGILKLDAGNVFEYFD